MTNKKDYQEALKNKKAFDNTTKRYFKIGMRLKQKTTGRGNNEKNKKK